ncbi:hypothetical protein [Halomonas sp. 707D7]|uniref:hypothetical protein n=2 Tax=unclassified Halomonas TaxID=2609666 RepID=UPI0020A07195|nr:hypothetical protein [Halomonas sp. 707D7]MCP1315367.1 hypothetical protein [Halomonas sp. 707D7]
MARSITLERRFDEDAARARFRRIRAARFEPAWVHLWAFAVGEAFEAPSAWLLSAGDMRRPLLLSHRELPALAAAPADGARLETGEPPAAETLAKQWLWERLARPRAWHVTLQPSPPTPLWLPCWIGYSAGDHTRIHVLSGLSGEALPQLKPVVLNAFKRAACAQWRCEKLFERE